MPGSASQHMEAPYRCLLSWVLQARARLPCTRAPASTHCNKANAPKPRHSQHADESRLRMTLGERPVDNSSSLVSTIPSIFYLPDFISTTEEDAILANLTSAKPAWIQVVDSTEPGNRARQHCLLSTLRRSRVGECKTSEGALSKALCWKSSFHGTPINFSAP